MSDTIKILHLEDLATDAELVLNELKNGGLSVDILLVSDKFAFEKALQDFNHDLILCDHSLSSFDSIEALRMVKHAGIDVPIILVTATMTDQSAASLMKEGACDYVLKDRLSRLPDAVRNAHRNCKAQKQQQLTEQRFRAMIENSADMKTLSTAEGKLLYVSPSVTRVLGYSTDEFFNTPGPELIHPDDLGGFMEQVQHMLQSGSKSFFSQHRLRHKTGNWLWCEGTMTNMLDQPAIQALVSNFRDVTARKIVEEQREFDQNNLTALINNTTDIMWSVDRNFNLITSNRAFDKMCTAHFDRTVSAGENVLSVTDKEEIINHFRCLYQRAFAGESFKETEYFHSPFQYWAEISYHPIINGENIIGAACFSRDITHIKKAEKLLRYSEAFNKGVLNSLSSHIAVVDSMGTIVAVNGAWTRFALENAQHSMNNVGVGSNYFRVCQKAGEESDGIALAALKGMKDVLQDNIPFFHLEYPCHSVEEERWFAMRVMKFDSDEPMIVVAHENITNIKKAELKVANTLRELENRVQERTQELSTTNRALKNEVLERVILSRKLEERNKDMTDSLLYAQRLQKAMLPQSIILLRNFSDAFILNRPKDIVSGDFYWFYKTQRKYMVALGDCTGHGVPGALMSIFGTDHLNNIVIDQQWKFPTLILELMDNAISHTFKGDESNEVKDGMDISFCLIDKAEQKIQFAGAGGSVVIISNSKARIYRGSRFGLGKFLDTKHKRFETIEIPYISGDMLYLYSDGFKDQFGGISNKKFTFTKQVELFEQVAHLPSSTQKEIIIKTFDNWKRTNEQVDDVLVVGLRL